MKKPFSEEFVWLFLLGLWMAGIFVMSSIEGTGERYWDMKILIERKGAHVFEFFVLAYLFWKVLNCNSFNFRKKIYLAFIFSLFYAVLDEFHQLFVFGREGKLPDVGIDGIGILFFLLLAGLHRSIRR